MKRLLYYLLLMGWSALLANPTFAQTTSKRASEGAIFRFSQPLTAGQYAFEPTALLWFPQPHEAEIKPEAFRPDAYFDQQAQLMKLRAAPVRYGAYLFTASQEYLYALMNGKPGWLRAPVPVAPAIKAQYRLLLGQQYPQRSSETGLKLGAEYRYIQITPFNDSDYVLVHNGSDNDFVLHLPTRRVTWRSGSRYEGATINFATDQLECSGDLLGGRFIFTRQGQLVPDKPANEQEAQAAHMLNRLISSPKTYQHIIDSLKQNYKPSANELMGDALETGKLSRVDSLLQHGVKVDSAVYIKGSKLTPLSHAVQLDNVPLMELLLKRGASATRRNRHDPDRRPPICFAKSEAALNLLFAHGANLQLIKYIDYYNRRQYPTEFLGDKVALRTSLLRHAPDSLFKQFDFYDTMLYRYIWDGDTVGIQQLLDRGASLVKPLRVGLKYPFAEAERSPPLFQAGTARMAMFLLRHGARLDNPFHLPLDREAFVLRLQSLPLLSYAEKRLGLKLTTPNNPTFAVLKDTVMMQNLMKRGVSINSIDSYGNTALIYAKQWDQNVPLEKFLLRHGADKAIVNKRGGSYSIGRERPYVR